MSIPDWRTYAFMGIGGTCLPCCDEVVDCECALTVPSVPLYLQYNPAKNYPYASYADARYAMDNYVSNCLVYNSQYDSVADTYVTYDSYDASFDGEELIVSGSVTSDGAMNNFNRVVGWVAVTLQASSVLTIGYAASIMAGTAVLNLNVSVYKCSGQVEDSVSLSEETTSVTGSLVTGALAAGQYIIFFSADGSDVGSTTQLDVNVTCDKVYVINPPRAEYSGDVLIDACPKMLIPPLTESSLSYYSDIDQAESVLLSQTTNCIGYIEETAYNEYGVSSLGGELTTKLGGKYESPAPPQDSLHSWSSINALAGESLSIAFSAVGGSSTNYEIEVYDDGGVLIDSYSGTSSPFVIASLPYSGKYIIKVGFTTTLTDGNTILATFVASSSGTISVNPIQALYTVSGLECPDRVDCSCLECESKGGAIPFCGRPEWEGTEGFTKWYKTITYSGSIIYETFDNSTPRQCVSKAEYAFTESCEKTVGEGCNECNTTQYGKKSIYAGCTDSVLTDEFDICDSPTTSPGNPGCDISTTPTVFTLSGIVPTVDPPFVMTTVTGTATATLSNEDTREAAIDRLLACSEWARNVCVSISSDNVYLLNRWRIRKQDLLPLTTYSFAVEYWRRVAGSTGAWTLYATASGSDTTDSDGLLLTDYVDTPITDGYETKVVSDCVFTVVE